MATYVEVDDDLPTTEEMTVEDIIESQNYNKNEEDDDETTADTDATQQTCPKVYNVLEAIFNIASILQQQSN